MKRKFNLICVLIFLTAAFGVIYPQASTLPAILEDGFIENALDESNSQNMPKTVAAVEMLPKRFPFNYPDSILNRRTGTYEKMHVMCAAVNSDAPEPSAALSAVNSVLALFDTLMLFVCLNFFIKIVLAVRRGEIFFERMERWLRICGYALIANYLSGWAIMVLNLYRNMALFDFEQYNMRINTYPSVTIMLAGLGLLLIAEIFSMARTMKEEQALTI